MRNGYKILVSKQEKMKQLVRPRRGWENIIRMDLKETGCDVVDWIQLAQIRIQWRAFVNTAVKPRVL